MQEATQALGVNYRSKLGWRWNKSVS